MREKRGGDIVIIVIVSFARATPPNVWRRETTGSRSPVRYAEGTRTYIAPPLPFDDLNAFLLGIFFPLLFVFVPYRSRERPPRAGSTCAYRRPHSVPVGSGPRALRFFLSRLCSRTVLYTHARTAHAHTQQTHVRTHATRSARRHHRQSTNRRARGEATFIILYVCVCLCVRVRVRYIPPRHITPPRAAHCSSLALSRAHAYTCRPENRERTAEFRNSSRAPPSGASVGC